MSISTQRALRRGFPAAFVVTGVLGLGLAACSSPHHGATSTTGTTSSTSTSAAPASTTTSTASSSSTACQGGALSASLSGSEGAAGTFELTFSLRDISTTSCTMDGFPGALLLGSSGAALPTNVVRAGSYSFTNFSSSSVMLPAGGTAYFNLGYSDVTVAGETSCEMATAIQFIPPGATTHVVVSTAMSVCNHGTVTVSPVFGSASPEVQTTAPPHP